MANSDYEKTGFGSFASVLKLDAPLDFTTTDIPYTVFKFAGEITPGMAAMVDDEIMSVEEVAFFSITVKRGCADTVPAPHAADSTVWIFDASSVGGDRKEWNAGETIGVKISPYTMAGSMPIPQVAPKAVTFDWRFTRPYPPAKLTVNSGRWFAQPIIDDTTPALYFSWAHRDRVLQADKLVGHEDATIGPEAGVTYTLRIYNPISDTLVREEVGIVGDTFTYRRAQAVHDQGDPSEVLEPNFTLTATRDGIDSWQHYSGAFTLVPKYPLDSNYLAFDQRMIETPFVVNARKGVTPEGNFALGMAARPSDRMSDSFDLIANGVFAQAGDYTPWLTSDFKLPELETIVNVRSSSLFDGVPLDATLVGKLALIDDEIVLVVSVINTKQIEVARGCCDTIPAVHIAGSRMWFFDADCAFDALDRASGSSVDYKLRPGVYGPAVPLADLPTETIAFGGRSSRPYPPGQVVVDGRPWFEEAKSTATDPVKFSWARRNRIEQGSTILGHADDDVEPDPIDLTRLWFYYETPDFEFNNLRAVYVSGTSFDYTRAMAVADGDTAGRAQGICGTVVIHCEISTISVPPAPATSITSTQSYVVDIVVPSYPCGVGSPSPPPPDSV